MYTKETAKGPACPRVLAPKGRSEPGSEGVGGAGVSLIQVEGDISMFIGKELEGEVEYTRRGIGMNE